MTREIRTWHHVDRQRFESEILPVGQPAVLKGLVADWPLVRKGLESPAAAAQYLQTDSPRTQVEYLVGDPAIRGRFFYNETMSGVNFKRGRADFAAVLQQLVALIGNPKPPAVSLQALAVETHVPALLSGLPMQLAPPGTQPKLWIGNALHVAPHFDLNDNIACVAVGRRRFWLCPPEQLQNLYVGPLEATPQGVPISLVDINRPDMTRFPRFAQARAAAQSAVLDAGDAIFIPYMWWHAVDSLNEFNVLVNYWWNGAAQTEGAPFHALLHAIATIAKLPPSQRAVWKAFFDYYVFATAGDPAQHLAAPLRGILGELEPAQVANKLLEIAQVIAAGPPAVTPRPPPV